MKKLWWNTWFLCFLSTFSTPCNHWCSHWLVENSPFHRLQGLLVRFEEWGIWHLLSTWKSWSMWGPIFFGEETTCFQRYASQGRPFFKEPNRKENLPLCGFPFGSVDHLPAFLPELELSLPSGWGWTLEIQQCSNSFHARSFAPTSRNFGWCTLEGNDGWCFKTMEDYNRYYRHCLHILFLLAVNRCNARVTSSRCKDLFCTSYNCRVFFGSDLEPRLLWSTAMVSCLEMGYVWGQPWSDRMSSIRKSHLSWMLFFPTPVQSCDCSR